jgi:hypothetical protein
MQKIPSLDTPYLVLGRTPFQKHRPHMQNYMLPCSLGAATGEPPFPTMDLWYSFRGSADSKQMQEARLWTEQSTGGSVPPR